MLRTGPLLAALISLGASQAAWAADMPVKAPIYKAPIAAVANWTGFYMGANAGYGWGKTRDSVDFLPSAVAFGVDPFVASDNLTGALGGGQIGYNRQFNSFVMGIEADLDAASIKGDPFQAPLSNFAGTPVPGWFHSSNQKINALGTLRARLGVTPSNNWLLYATGGLAYGHIKTSSYTQFTAAPSFEYAATNSKWRAGWTVGAGVEWAFAGNWSAKAEYLHYDLGHQTFDALPLAPNAPYEVVNRWRARGEIVRVGINYHFNAYAPVVARY